MKQKKSTINLPYKKFLIILEFFLEINIKTENQRQFLLQHLKSELELNNKKHGFIVPYANSSDSWWCYGVGEIFLVHFGPLSTSWASLALQPEHCC